MKIRSIALAFCLSLFAAAAFGQGDAAIKPTYVKGDVVSVDSAKIVVKTDAGPWEGAVSDKTAFKRVSPANPTDLKGATTVAITDIGAGDKIVLSALGGSDGRFNVRSVYLMTKADISAKQQSEAEMWRTRGILGKVVSISPASNQVTIEVANGLDKTTLAVVPKSGAKWLRYAPESVNFADARPSSIAAIVVGDRLRAVGDKDADGKTFTAEIILTGGFRQTVGKIKSVDADKKEAVIEDLASKKDVTVQFANAIFLKKFPAEMAQRMAGAQMGGGPGGVRPPGGGVTPPAGATVVVQQGGQPNGGGAGFRPGGAQAGGNLDAMVDRMPNITAADLKAGDMIAVLTSGPVTPNASVKALKLLAGVEPFIEMARRQAAMSGARGAAGGPNFNIPGLDGGLGLP
jgi:ribosomal protein L24